MLIFCESTKPHCAQMFWLWPCLHAGRTVVIALLWVAIALVLLDKIWLTNSESTFHMTNSPLNPACSMLWEGFSYCRSNSRNLTGQNKLPAPTATLWNLQMIAWFIYPGESLKNVTLSNISRTSNSSVRAAFIGIYNFLVAVGIQHFNNVFQILQYQFAFSQK